MIRNKKEQRQPLDNGTLKRVWLRKNFLDQIEENLTRIRKLELFTKPSESLNDAYVKQGRQQVHDGWALANVPANQSEVTLARFGFSSVPLMRAVSGNLTRIEIAASEARASGSLEVEVFVNGTGTDFKAIINEEDTLVAFEIAGVGEFQYSAGDSIELKYTTSSNWLPTSSDIFCTLHLSET